MTRVMGLILIVIALMPSVVMGQSIGPVHGALVLVGGAMRDPAIVHRFIELAGGRDAPLVIIPTAGGREHYDQDYPGARVFRDAGVIDLTVLHTTDREEADTEAFVDPLRRAKGAIRPRGRQGQPARPRQDGRHCLGRRSLG